LGISYGIGLIRLADTLARFMPMLKVRELKIAKSPEAEKKKSGNNKPGLLRAYCAMKRAFKAMNQFALQS
jgi:hypothetical protein